MSSLPFVSIAIPCRNEEKFIGRCLDSVIANDYPKDELEVLVVDGMSEDRTRKIVEKYSEQYPFIRVLENPKKNTPCALNIGIKHAWGEIIIGMGAHSTYQNDYISKCVKYLYEYNADNVGGTMITLPRENTVVARAIAFALSNPFGVGGSTFRKGSKKPKWVDTVFGGCYKREVFEKNGLFNENLIRNEDLEFNLRLKKTGGKILLVPEIVAYYYPKSNFKDFFLHNFKDGFWVTYPLKFGIKTFRWRHLVPLFFISGLIGTGILACLYLAFFHLFLLIVVLYFLTNLYFSAKIAYKERDFRYLFLMPIAFICRHIPYGLGSILGLIKSFPGWIYARS